MSVWYIHLGILACLLNLTAGIISTSPSRAQELRLPEEPTLVVSLTDGAYQFCTEPPPQDWRDGAGGCLNVQKTNTTLDGYYGYPHSGSFVCLRGNVSNHFLSGRGLVMSWAGYNWPEIPQKDFYWDKEQRLLLSQGKQVGSEGEGQDQINWIMFQTATLNLKDLYRYPEVRMTKPGQLCDWRFGD